MQICIPLNSMKISIVQFSPAWKAPEANRTSLKNLLARVPETDLIVLPEMFSTGFVTDPAGVAEKDGESLRFMQETAAQRNCAVAGSLAVEEEGAFFNRFYFVYPDGSEVHYDKHHLYKSGGEAEFFTPGNRRPIWEYRGVKIRLAICYDLRFPVWLRQDKHKLYDILIVVACWPTIRIQYWDALLAARAAENHCYGIGVNMVGTDGLQLDYNGHSAAYDTWLKDIAGFEDYEEGTKIVDLSIEKLRHFREVLPQWKEADEYELKADN